MYSIYSSAQNKRCSTYAHSHTHHTQMHAHTHEEKDLSILQLMYLVALNSK